MYLLFLNFFNEYVKLVNTISKINKQTVTMFCYFDIIYKWVIFVFA